MRTLHILNLGAGVQSTALYVMSCRQDEPEHVPIFDYAIFADTQEEPQAVYDHLEWLKSLGGPQILVRTAGKLGNDLIEGINTTGQNNRMASIPAFTLSGDGKIGITRRQCTKEYKTAVVERTIRRAVLGLAPGQHIPKDIRIVQYLGLSFDEPKRIISVKARFQEISWATPRFPLFELLMTRHDCQEYNRQHVPHEIQRSACVFCPFKSNAEWRRLRSEDTVGWERACEVDDKMRMAGADRARHLRGSLFVHRSAVPLRDADIESPESRGDQYTFGFSAECEGMCGL